MPESTPQNATELERLHLLFSQSRSTSVMAVVAATVCAVIVHHAAPGPAPWVWLGAVLAVTAGRLLLYRRYFRTGPSRTAPRTWLRWHAMAAIPTGIAAGALPLLPMHGAPSYIHELQTLVPALVAMAAVTSFGIYYAQYLVLLISILATAVLARLWIDGLEGVTTALMLCLLAPLLALTARRYGDSINRALRARLKSEELVAELTRTNDELERRNTTLARQQDRIHKEEQLAKHVFRQLTLGGDHELPGVHTWNQAMGSLSGDLIQTARGPDGQAYVLLGDFTGHGLPAALGALPASSVFLAMAAKGLPVESIAPELNRKLHELLPVGYFCCAVLLELSADRSRLHVWNGGLPPVLLRRQGTDRFEKVISHSLPLGVLGEHEFDTDATVLHLGDDDVVYAYTDGLIEAENRSGDMWGTQRLESFLMRNDPPAPKLPLLIDAVLEHVNLAPVSDDISVVELIASTKDAAAAAAA